MGTKREALYYKVLKSCLKSWQKFKFWLQLYRFYELLILRLWAAAHSEWDGKSGGRFQHWPSCFPWRSWITLRRDKRGILWTLTSQSLWRLKLSRRRATETMSLQIKIISISQTGLKGHSAEHPRRWCFMSWNSLFFQKVAVGVLQFHQIECEHSECGKD